MAIPWHRIFGMALTQYLAGTAWKVVVEVDLSLQQQRLDLVVLRRGDNGPEPVWPDGFGTPAEHNLLTFKALQDPLNACAIKELACHGVNYRKLVSPSPDDLLPEEHFRLLAASMHFPRQLTSRIHLQPVSPGAYDVMWGTDSIRILVLREMPEAEQNLVWNLFSGDQGRISSAFQRIQPRVSSWSSTLNSLLGFYGLEGIPMPYTVEEFERDTLESIMRRLSPEKLRTYLTPEQLLQLLSPKQRVESLSPEEVLSLLPREVIENYLKTHTPGAESESPKPPETPS